jgi:cell wall assembly regulator SMI1
VELRGQEADPLRAAPRPTPRRHLADAAGDVERVQEFRKCIECFLCQDVCHVLRDHHKHKTSSPARASSSTLAALEMHPLDTEDRIVEELRTRTASATATSPSAAPRSAPSTSHITDNAIIPLKERVVDEFYDPELLPQLDSEYARVYYEGILDERRGRAQLERGGPAVGPAAHEWLRRAMDCYDRAAELAEPGNAEALLRWNTCVRLIESHAELRAEETTQELMLE